MILEISTKRLGRPKIYSLFHKYVFSIMPVIANTLDYKSPQADYDLIRRNLNLQVAMLGE